MSDDTVELKKSMVRQILLFTFLGPLLACIMFGIAAELLMPQPAAGPYALLLIGFASSLPAATIFLLCATFAVKAVVNSGIEIARWPKIVLAITYIAGVAVIAGIYVALDIDAEDAARATDAASLARAFVKYLGWSALAFLPVFLLAPVVMKTRPTLSKPVV
ncbi:MAG: hypothetical protein JNK21_12425 [Rhodospirillaceae bacterium]|nr:hypothetical protein [Rhodospirillaceae bacterium]